MQTLDMAVAREFGTSERFRFQIRAEFFNTLNQVNLGTPNRFVNTPQFGTITEAATPGGQIQLSARFSFLESTNAQKTSVERRRGQVSELVSLPMDMPSGVPTTALFHTSLASE